MKTLRVLLVLSLALIEPVVVAQTAFSAAEYTVLHELLAVGELGRPYTLALYDKSVPVPSFGIDIPTHLNVLLEALDRVPQYSPFLHFEKQQTVRNILQSALKDVTLIPRQLSETAKERFKTAQQVLYQDPDKKEPTRSYQDYLNYEKSITDIRRQIEVAKTEEARRKLLSDLQYKTKHWPNVPAKMQIEDAQATLRSLSDPTVERFSAWTNLLQSAAGTELSSCLKDLGEQSDWTEIAWNSESRPAAPSAMKTFIDMMATLPAARYNIGNGTDFTEIAIKSPIHIRLELKQIAINRGYIGTEFLLTRNWKLTNAGVLSNGVADTDADELLPRTCQKALFIRRIVIYLPEEESTDKLLHLLDDDKVAQVLIGNIFIKHPKIPAPSHYGRSILTSSVQLLGAILKEMPKTPNPEIN